MMSSQSLSSNLCQNGYGQTYEKLISDTICFPLKGESLLGVGWVLLRSCWRSWSPGVLSAGDVLEGSMEKDFAGDPGAAPWCAPWQSSKPLSDQLNFKLSKKLSRFQTNFEGTRTYITRLVQRSCQAVRHENTRSRFASQDYVLL